MGFRIRFINVVCMRDLCLSIPVASAVDEKFEEVFSLISLRLLSAAQLAIVITLTKTHRCKQAYPQHPEEENRAS